MVPMTRLYHPSQFRQEGTLPDRYRILHNSNPPPPLTKWGGGGVDFLKFGNEGGDEIFFLEKEGLD